MDKKISRIIAGIMLIAAVFFVAFAFQHPEMSWPWSNAITYRIYLVYLIVMAILFIAPFKRKNKQQDPY